MPAAIARSRAASQYDMTSFAMYSNIPAALHSSVTENPSRSSFARRSASDSPRSTSYLPSEAATALARLDNANPYVRSTKASSADREGNDTRGDEPKSLDESVVRQLKTVL